VISYYIASHSCIFVSRDVPAHFRLRSNLRFCDKRHRCDVHHRRIIHPLVAVRLQHISIYRTKRRTFIGWFCIVFCEHSFFFSRFSSFRHDLRPFIHANIPVCPITVDCSKHPERVFQQCPNGGCAFKLLFVRGQILYGKALFAGISGKDHVSISPKWQRFTPISISPKWQRFIPITLRSSRVE